MGCGNGHAERYQKGDGSELQSQSAILFYAAHVKFQGSEKHYEIDSYLPKYFEAAVAFYNVKSVMSDDYTCQYQSYDVRNVQAAQQNGCAQYDNQNQKEYPCVVSDKCRILLYYG